jgi:hypothetical protein
LEVRILKGLAFLQVVWIPQLQEVAEVRFVKGLEGNITPLRKHGGEGQERQKKEKIPRKINLTQRPLGFARGRL